MLMDTMKMVTGAAVVKEDGSTPYTGAAVYDIAGSTLSKPTDAAKIMRFSVSRAFNLPAGLTGSFAESVVATTSSTVYSIKKNGTEVGTMTFGAASTAATFAMASLTSFVVGDILTVEAPATADATHDELAWTFAAVLA